jgi:hypothetical protein
VLLSAAAVTVGSGSVVLSEPVSAAGFFPHAAIGNTIAAASNTASIVFDFFLI